VLGGSVGGFTLLVALIISGYFLIKWIQRYRARSVFLAAMCGAKEGQTALIIHLPPDDDGKSLSLRAQYIPEVVLGKGAHGSVVVRAEKKHKSGEHNLKTGSTEVVALKIIVPKKGIFSENEKQKLQTEAHLLALVTAKKCKSAANAVESTGPVIRVPQSPHVCWFIMEALGPSAAAVKPIGVAACAQLARDVLAALKIIHGDNWVHCDVTPTNIVRCNPSADILKKQHGFEYKLIDFDSAQRTDEGAILQAVTGSPEYRAPEMFGQDIIITKAADIWSLGVTMFEVLADRLPFPSDSPVWTASIMRDTARRAPDIRNYIAEGQLQSVAPGLDAVIAKAMEKNRISRQALNLGGPFKSSF
jgi:serine/threonine protein kinase